MKKLEFEGPDGATAAGVRQLESLELGRKDLLPLLAPEKGVAWTTLAISCDAEQDSPAADASFLKHLPRRHARPA